MLRMMLVGLLIPLGIGVLSAMELRTPPRSAVAIVQPLAEPMADDSDSHEALAKGDRLEVTVVSRTPEQAVVRSETPEQPALIEGITLPENNSIGASEPPRPIDRHHPKSKKVRTAVLPRPKPRAKIIKRAAISQHSKAAGEPEPCRLKAFGGLRKALDTADCDI
jgi:hypothetical protein